MYKLIIFDLDGTLLDTIGDLATACNVALERNNFAKHPVDSYYGFVGNGFKRLIELAIGDSSVSDSVLEETKNIAMNYYNNNCTTHTKPYSGIIELVNNLLEDGAMVAVASNKHQDGVERIVSHYFPNNNFIATLGQREGVPLKPHPAILNEVMNIAKVDASETLFVGDSLVDFETGSNVKGLRFIGVEWGFEGGDALIEAKVKDIATSTSYIWDIYRSNE